MSQAVKCDLLLYADDICLTFQHENVKEIEDQLNLNFCSLCDWFIDNKLSIHPSEDKTKSILFRTKFNIKRAEPLNIVYDNVKIKQHTKVTYLQSVAKIMGKTAIRAISCFYPFPPINNVEKQ